MTNTPTAEERRTCEFCGSDNPASQISCWKCGLWKDHKYRTVEAQSSKQKMFDAVRTQVESLLERDDLQTREREHLSRSLSELNGLFPQLEDETTSNTEEKTGG